MKTNWKQILRHYPEITGIHPAADLFPLVEGEEFTELCADIKQRGLAQPITIWTDGTLLDGRNRLLACYETHQEVVLDRYEGTDPVQFSLSANLHRRHLNAGQGAIVALKVRELLQPAVSRPSRPVRSALPATCATSPMPRARRSNLCTRRARLRSRLTRRIEPSPSKTS